ncbi:MAG: hydroxymethylbilane synthase [Phycisphaeraceae bacterium]|nr:hydroxymethylbilane synthase [Phycisphaeraceae bacterium]
MRRARRPLVIVSRNSPLARWQAEHVGTGITRQDSRQAVSYQWWTGSPQASGNHHPDRNKGRFTSALERLLLKNEGDLAVHSLKDLPVEDTPGLRIAAVPAREDVRDCLITPDGLALSDLPERATVATSSPRRAMQLRELRPDLQIVPIEGNIETRLALVTEHRRFDATVLALAGLRRLNLESKVPMSTFSIEQMLPAAGQGALAVQCRATDHHAMLNVLGLNDPTTSQAVHAERALLAGLGCDCDSPVAAHCRPDAQTPGTMHLTLRWSPTLEADGYRELQGSATVKRLSQLVREMVAEIRRPGRRSYSYLRGISGTSRLGSPTIST